MEYETTPAVIGVCADDSLGGGGVKAHNPRTVALDLDSFAWEALEQESAELGVSIEELLGFAVVYYLADRDSGRIARRLPQRHKLGEPHPLGKLLGD